MPRWWLKSGMRGRRRSASTTSEEVGGKACGPRSSTGTLPRGVRRCVLVVQKEKTAQNWMRKTGVPPLTEGTRPTAPVGRLRLLGMRGTGADALIVDDARLASAAPAARPHSSPVPPSEGPQETTSPLPKGWGRGGKKVPEGVSVGSRETTSR